MMLRRHWIVYWELCMRLLQLRVNKITLILKSLPNFLVVNVPFTNCSIRNKFKNMNATAAKASSTRATKTYFPPRSTYRNCLFRCRITKPRMIQICNGWLQCKDVSWKPSRRCNRINQAASIQVVTTGTATKPQRRLDYGASLKCSFYTSNGMVFNRRPKCRSLKSSYLSLSPFVRKICLLRVIP